MKNHSSLHAFRPPNLSSRTVPDYENDKKGSARAELISAIQMICRGTGLRTGMFAAFIVAAMGGRIAFAGENDEGPANGQNAAAASDPAANDPIQPPPPQAISTHNLA